MLVLGSVLAVGRKLPQEHQGGTAKNTFGRGAQSIVQEIQGLHDV